MLLFFLPRLPCESLNDLWPRSKAPNYRSNKTPSEQAPSGEEASMGSWVPAVRRRLAARSGGGLDRRGRRRSFLAGPSSVLAAPPRNGWQRSGWPVRSGWGCRRVSRGGREAKVRGEAAAGIGRKPHPARSNGGTNVNLEIAAESCWFSRILPIYSTAISFDLK